MMKELLNNMKQIDYQKKYEEALKTAKILRDNSTDKVCNDKIEAIFPELIPELQESEDERIRKAIIRIVKMWTNSVPTVDGIPVETLLDWLEKQGELVKSLSKGLDNAHERIDGLIQKNNSLIEQLEKQGEQKSTDIAEPKFKNGQWIVWQDKCYKVNYNGCGYELVDQNGLSTSLEYGTIDENAHLWDIIQDAKDGDVLAVDWHEGDDLWEKIIIFKKYHNKGVEGLLNSPCVEGYGNTFKNGKLAFSEEIPFYSKTWTANLHPAIIEQRDKLEKAITAAGYKWNKENLKLEKI